jgi:hypothetical protein
MGNDHRKKLDDLSLKRQVGKVLSLSLVSNRQFQTLIQGNEMYQATHHYLPAGASGQRRVLFYLG